MALLETSIFDSLPVIVFENVSRGCVEAIVCDGRDTLEREVVRLREMPHIRIVTVKHAVVKRAASGSQLAGRIPIVPNAP